MGMSPAMWDDDKVVIIWFSEYKSYVEGKVADLTKNKVVEEVFKVLTAGGNTAKLSKVGVVEGLKQACEAMSLAEKEEMKKMLKDSLQI